MKQVTQNYRSGLIRTEDVPVPSVRKGFVLVKNRASLISAGTERSKVAMGEKNMLQKALARPDLVKQVLNKIRQEGILSTYNKVMHRLESSSPLGYSSAGIVVETGEGVTGFSVGDHVACAGAGYANHSEYVCVPVNLCARIPVGIDFSEAAFTTLGSIAMQGVRQADPKLGNNICVIGLGLLGQITAQILTAAGCRVFGIDLSPDKLSLAKELGVQEAVLKEDGGLLNKADAFTSGLGFDSVIITASGKSNDAVVLAGMLAMDRGRVVVVGDVRLDIPRKDYYAKELNVLMSRSYGPGRYDPVYEEKGTDYPIGYVRWTERRNMEEFLRLVLKKSVNVEKLITHRFDVMAAPKAYELVSGKKKEPYMGIILQYLHEKDHPRRIYTGLSSRLNKYGSSIGTGFIGAGNFALGVLLPAVKSEKRVCLKGICSASGLSAKNASEKFGFEYASSGAAEIIADDKISALFIVTSHDLHARLTIDSLRSGKAVFVEKPLCLKEDELEEIMAEASRNPALMVGFNRRFSPHTAFIKEQLSSRSGNCVINCRINAGSLIKNSWIHDLDKGGGRIKSEVCHFVDLLTYLTSSHPQELFAFNISGSDPDVPKSDNIVVNMRFFDGSLGSIVYTSKGSPEYGKEYIEIFSDGAVMVIDDFRKSLINKKGNMRVFKTNGQDKGHREEIRRFFCSLMSAGEMPIPLNDIYISTSATFAILDSIAKGLPVKLA